MQSKKYASELRSQFWTTFGKYMSLTPNAEGIKSNWINYKTGVKNIFFRMDATNKTARISIDITHPDDGIRALFYEQFLEFRFLLHETIGEEWNWNETYFNNSGKAIACIYSELHNNSVFQEENWPTLFSFFKPRIIALDLFWSDAKDIFIDLE